MALGLLAPFLLFGVLKLAAKIQYWRWDRLHVSAWEPVKAALAAENPPPWVGTYSEPGYHGAETVLHLSTAGFYCGYGRPRFDPPGFGWGPEVEGPWGTLEPLAPDRLAFQVAWRGDFLGIFVKRPGPIRTLHLIPWEDRVYAVSEEKMLEFINAVNSQLELDGRHYPLGYAFKGEAGSVRNPPKPRSPPLLPEKWRNHLLTRPIEARVLAVGRVQYRKRPYGAERFVPIKISAGSKQGLKAGHLLHIANFDRATPVNNFTVGEETSTGEAGEGQEWNPLETERLPRVGQAVTSRAQYEDEWAEK